VTICINQKDDGEKSQRVQMMRDTFSDAAQVIIWLGLATEESRIGMENISRLVDLWRNPKSTLEDARREDVHHALLLEAIRDFFDRDTESHNVHIPSVRHIYEKSWWSECGSSQKQQLQRTPGFCAAPMPLGSSISAI
jgi:hypothetical protein